MIELISVHIPKTGGTSLAKLLRRRYGKRFHQYIEPPETVNWPALKRYLKYSRKRLFALPPRCVHGHFPASRYANSPAQMITFIRDPAERALSEFRYIHRHHQQTGIVPNRSWLDVLRKDEISFMSSAVNIFARYADVEASRFAFVGHMDDYDNDLSRLAGMLDVEEFAVPLTNTAPQKTMVSEELRDAFRKANSREFEIYDRLVEQRNAVLSDTGSIPQFTS